MPIAYNRYFRYVMPLFTLWPKISIGSFWSIYWLYSSVQFHWLERNCYENYSSLSTMGFTSEGRRRGSGSPGPKTCHILRQGASGGSRGLQSCLLHISHEWSTERKRRQSSNHSPTPSLLSWSKPFLLTHLAPLLWLISVLQRVCFIGGRDTASVTMGWGSVTPSFSPSC